MPEPISKQTGERPVCNSDAPAQPLHEPSQLNNDIYNRSAGQNTVHTASKKPVFETTPVEAVPVNMPSDSAAEIARHNVMLPNLDLNGIIENIDFDTVLIGAIILLLLLDGTDDYWLLIALVFILLSDFIS